jgi:DNA-binding MarR family transcriptional regulator
MMPSDRQKRLAAEGITTAERMRRLGGRVEPDWSTPEEYGTRAAGPAQLPGWRSETLRRWCELAARLYRFRRRRDRVFGAIFGEPAWDILLDLFIMEAKAKRVAVSSACIASGASHATALRQIDELVRCALVLRERDPHDKRRTYIALSDEGMHKMGLALEQLAGQAELRTADMIPDSALSRG